VRNCSVNVGNDASRARCFRPLSRIHSSSGSTRGTMSKGSGARCLRPGHRRRMDADAIPGRRPRRAFCAALLGLVVEPLCIASVVRSGGLSALVHFVIRFGQKPPSLGTRANFMPSGCPCTQSCT
jgi:hypothetical protein